MTDRDSKLFREQLVWHTEATLFGALKSKTSQVPMWLQLEDLLNPEQGDLQLVPVSTKEHWRLLRELRRHVEIPFGVTDPHEIDRFIEEIRTVVTTFSASWFIAYLSEEAVGEIGLVEFRDRGAPFGRLLDVDILPQFQGRGLGNQLLSAICAEARQRGLSALCLKADTDRWVKEWYGRRGFKEVGLWHPATH